MPIITKLTNSTIKVFYELLVASDKSLAEPEDAWVLLDQAAEHNLNRNPDALVLAETAYKMAPNIPVCRLVIGEVYLKVKDYNNALPHLNYFADLSLKHYLGYQLYAECLIGLRQFEEANGQYDKAICIARELGSPADLSKVLAHKARLMNHLGRNEEAIALCQEAQKIAPSLAAFVAESDALRAQGANLSAENPVAAKKFFGQAYMVIRNGLALFPESLELLIVKGKCYDDIGNHRFAINLYNHCLTKDRPDNLIIIAAKAQAYFKWGKYAEALDCMKQVTEKLASGDDFELDSFELASIATITQRVEVATLLSELIQTAQSIDKHEATKKHFHEDLIFEREELFTSYTDIRTLEEDECRPSIIAERIDRTQRGVKPAIIELLSDEDDQSSSLLARMLGWWRDKRTASSGRFVSPRRYTIVSLPASGSATGPTRRKLLAGPFASTHYQRSISNQAASAPRPNISTKPNESAGQTVVKNVLSESSTVAQALKLMSGDISQIDVTALLMQLAELKARLDVLEKQAVKKAEISHLVIKNAHEVELESKYKSIVSNPTLQDYYNALVSVCSSYFISVKAADGGMVSAKEMDGLPVLGSMNCLPLPAALDITLSLLNSAAIAYQTIKYKSAVAHAVSLRPTVTEFEILLKEAAIETCIAKAPQIEAVRIENHGVFGLLAKIGMMADRVVVNNYKTAAQKLGLQDAMKMIACIESGVYRSLPGETDVLKIMNFITNLEVETGLIDAISGMAKLKLGNDAPPAGGAGRVEQAGTIVMAVVDVKYNNQAHLDALAKRAVLAKECFGLYKFYRANGFPAEYRMSSPSF